MAGSAPPGMARGTEPWAAGWAAYDRLPPLIRRLVAEFPLPLRVTNLPALVRRYGEGPVARVLMDKKREIEAQPMELGP